MPAILPPSPTSKETVGAASGWKPYEVNPDLAAAHLVENMMSQFGTPGIVSKEFVVWRGIFYGLNDRSGNKTYYDSSLRLAVYDGVFHNSVNIDGENFQKYWQYMMKPKVILQGQPGSATFEEEEKSSLWDRTIGRFFGGKKNDNISSNQ